MKAPTDHEELLGDILEDSLPPGARARIFGQTMAAMRRRRRSRLTANIAVPLVLVAAVILFSRGNKQISLPPGQPAITWISSMPLAAAQIVQTRRDSISYVTSMPGTFGRVTNATEPDSVKVLDDQGLLSLLAGKNAAIIHEAPGQADLVFANPENLNGFPMRP